MKSLNINSIDFDAEYEEEISHTIVEDSVFITTLYLGAKEVDEDLLFDMGLIHSGYTFDDFMKDANKQLNKELELEYKEDHGFKNTEL